MVLGIVMCTCWLRFISDLADTPDLPTQIAAIVQV
jgi:hypothetical protein